MTFASVAQPRLPAAFELACDELADGRRMSRSLAASPPDCERLALACAFAREMTGAWWRELMGERAPLRPLSPHLDQ